MGSLPIGREARALAVNLPESQQAGFHADQAGSHIVMGIVAHHQALVGRHVQPGQNLVKIFRVWFAVSARFIIRNMVKNSVINICPGQTGFNDRPRENRVGCQHHRPTPPTAGFKQ